MNQWSILSYMLNYIQYDRHPKNFHNLDISAVNICKAHSVMREEKNRIECRLLSKTGYIKGRISQCISGNPVRNSKYHKV